MLENLKATLVEVEFFCRDENVPFDHTHEKALQFVNVGQRYSANLCDELVCIVCVVKHFGRDQDGCQNQSKTKKSQVLEQNKKKEFVLEISASHENCS